MSLRLVFGTYIFLEEFQFQVGAIHDRVKKYYQKYGFVNENQPLTVFLNSVKE